MNAVALSMPRQKGYPLIGEKIPCLTTIGFEHWFTEAFRWWAILSFLVLSACLPLAAQSISNPGRDRQRARFLDLAYKAKTAKRAGQKAKAQDLWRQARSLAPHPTDPGWLDSLPPAFIPADPAEQRAALLASAAKSLAPRSVADLEDWLIRHPWDSQVRLLLLEEARKTGNLAMEQRHASFLGENPHQARKQAGKLVLGTVLLALIVWQARELFADFRKTRG